MIFVIMNYGVDRNQAGRSWKTKALVFAVSATFAATFCGLALGAVGLAVPADARPGFVAAMAVAALALALSQLVAGTRWVPQRDCETGQLWMHTGGLTGAALNGAALGTGFLTRVGYWLWYAIPAACVVAGPARAALIFGTYGLARGSAPGVAIVQMILRRSCEKKDVTRMQEWLIQRGIQARTMANGTLLVCAVYALTEVIR